MPKLGTISLKKSQQREVKRITEYLVSGGAYFWSGYLLFFITYTGLHWTLWWAKLAANIFGWIINYVLQRYWVFNNPKLSHHKTEVTGRYIFITLVDWLLDYLIVYGLRSIGLTPYLGQFVSAGFFTFWNYAWYKLWVFPQKYPKKRQA